MEFHLEQPGIVPGVVMHAQEQALHLAGRARGELVQMVEDFPFEELAIHGAQPEFDAAFRGEGRRPFEQSHLGFADQFA